MITYTTISVKGTGTINEDALVINEELNLFGVLDGVSSLTSYRNQDNQTGGYIAANLVKSHLEKAAAADNLEELIIESNDRLNKQMRKENINLSKKDELWGTAVAVVKLTPHHVHFVQTGDCMIIAVYQSGEVRPLTFPQVSHLDEKALQVMKQALTEGKDVKQATTPILKGNRGKSNTLGGYGVLNGEKDAKLFLESGKINTTNLDQLILFSDGLFLPAELAENMDTYWEKTIELILSKGLVQYTQDLIDLEENDPDCKKFLRFKPSDDKTGMVIKFSK